MLEEKDAGGYKMKLESDGYEHNIIEPTQKTFLAVLFVTEKHSNSQAKKPGGKSSKNASNAKNDIRQKANTNNIKSEYNIYEWKVNRDGSRAKIYKNHEQRLIISLRPIHNSEAEMQICISSSREKSSGNEISLTYKDFEARKLLTRIFHDKMHFVEFRNQDCEITKTVLNNGTVNCEPSLILKDIIIGKDGGFVSSENYKHQKVVGALVYSKRHRIYESIYVTYNQLSNEYYMDGRTFVRFVREHGAPHGNIYILMREKRQLENLSDESILSSLGYNVNSKDSLSDKERQDILSVVIDLKLMSREGIINLLKFNISLHNNERYEIARRKWERDIEFVYNYKIKSDACIIAKNI